MADKKIKLIEDSRIKHTHGTKDTIEFKVENAPHTVFGHSSLSPSFSLIMNVDGLRKILDHADDEDSLRITFTECLSIKTGNSTSHIKYTILKKEG